MYGKILGGGGGGDSIPQFFFFYMADFSKYGWIQNKIIHL